MINNTISTRTIELAETMKAFNNAENRVAAAAEWIRAKVSNSGISLTINFSIDPVFTVEVVKELLPILHADDSILVEEVCESAIKVQCMNKIRRIKNLNRIQQLMFELKDFNPPLIEIGMSKLSPEEQLEIREILTFEK